MSNQERIKIIKDALSQIEARRFIPAHLSYVIAAGRERYSSYGWEDFDPGEETNLKKIMQGKACQVCALGSLFLARLEEHNNLYIQDKYGNRPLGKDAIPRDFASGDVVHKYLGEIFDKKELMLIELAFEGKAFAEEFLEGYDPEWSDDDDATIESSLPPEAHRAIEFGEACGPKASGHYIGDTQRIKGILNNMLENGGYFKP